MAELLEAKPLLGNFDHDFGAVRLTEAGPLAIVSLAVPQGDETKCEAALQGAYGVGMPPSGTYATSADGKSRIIRTAPDQLFVLFDHDTPDAREVVQAATGAAFWSTDQTDVWCALNISGPMTRTALERLCPLDLHPDVFGPNAAARTVMEHMGAMIMRTGDDAFLLMSARSSAATFLHALETSINWVL